MLIGYNTNIHYKGKTYHVQTEDSGLNSSMIVTLLYHRGAILHSKKTSYSHLVGCPDFKEELKNLMKKQHKDIIKRLIKGEFTQEQTSQETMEPLKQADKKPQKSMPSADSASKDTKSVKGKNKGLDDILLEHIAKRGNK